jgi:hypothetical protein
MCRRLTLSVALFAGLVIGAVATIVWQRSTGSLHLSVGEQIVINYPHPTPAFPHQRLTTTITVCRDNEDAPDAASRWDLRENGRSYIARSE